MGKIKQNIVHCKGTTPKTNTGKVHPKDKPSFLHLYLGDIGDKYDLFWDVNTEIKISTTGIILVPVGWLISGNFVN